MEFWIPYGGTEVPIRVPDDNFYKILEPPRRTPKDPLTLIQQSLDTPVGGTSLSSLGRGKAGLVVDPLVPQSVAKLVVEQLKARLLSLGIDSITVFQRKTVSSKSPVEDGFGTVVVVDPAEGPFVRLGDTASGTPVEVSEDFYSNQLKISLSMVTPHYATGLTGGPEAILPGLSSTQSIAKNRSLIMKTAASENGSASSILTDAFEACRIVGPLFSISCVPDGSGGLDSVFCGELEPTYKEATARYTTVHSPRIDVRPDILVLPAGNLLGRDLYHGVRVLPNAWNTVKKEGTIILAAECSKGIGDETFLEFSRKFEDRKALLTDLRHHFKLGGHMALLLKEAVERNRVQLVSVLPDHYVRMFNLKSARTASAAIQSSIRAEGKDARVLIVGRGDLTLPVFQPN